MSCTRLACIQVGVLFTLMLYLSHCAFVNTKVGGLIDNGLFFVGTPSCMGNGSITHIHTRDSRPQWP